MNQPVYSFEPGINDTAPLFLFVHGRAGTVRIMAGFSRCIPEGCARLYVQAPIPDPIGGFSWWLVNDPAADPWEASRALEVMLATIIPSLGIAPTVTAALGFSQGGAVLSMALQRDPTWLKGLALLASFVVRSPEPVPTGARPSILIAHGEHDEVVSRSEAERGYRYLSDLGWPAKLVMDPVGHKVGVLGMRALREWGQEVVGG